MHHPFSSLFIIASAVFLVPALPQAAEIPERGPIPFEAYDKDADGYISEQEFNTVRSERIAKRAAQGAPMRGVADAPPFSQFDSNGDGRLSREELATGQRAQMEQRRGTGMGMGPGSGTGPGMGRNMPAFSDYDLNGDGKIVENEFNEARGKRISERAQQGYPMRNIGNAPAFTDIDTNGDGAISAEEFAAHQSQHRPQGPR